MLRFLMCCLSGTASEFILNKSPLWGTTISFEISQYIYIYIYYFLVSDFL